MYKFLFTFLFAIFSNSNPSFSQGTDFFASVDTSFASKNTLGFFNSTNARNKSNINFNLGYSNKSLSSKLSLNYNDQNKINFDKSYVNYKKGIANLRIG